LQGVVYLKTYSFLQYLRKTKMAGFSKWCVINQVVKEEHPHGLSLLEIVKNQHQFTPGGPKQVTTVDDAPPEKDLIFQGLLKHYNESYLNLNEMEELTLLNRQEEFKTLSKKSVYMTYLFFNLNNMPKINDIVNVYVQYRTYCRQITAYLDSKNMSQRKEAEERIGDFDKMSEEIMQVLIIQQVTNMLQKYKAKHYEQRRDAYYSARLAAALCFQTVNEKKMIYRQYEQTLSEITQWYTKQKNTRDSTIEPQEIDNYNRLKTMFKAKKFLETDLFCFKQGEEFLPLVIKEQLKRIEAIKAFEFKDGIDTESHDYIYLNAFNQFRYENETIINMNAGMINKNTPMGESQMQQQIKRYGVSLLKQQFPDDFNVDSVFGAVDLPQDEIQGWTGS